MNNPTSSPRRLHPLIATAAGGIIVASLAATAAVTGLIPIASSSGLSGNATQAAPSTGTSTGTGNAPVVDSAAPANGNWADNAQTGAAQPTQQPAQASANPQTGGEIQWNFTKFLVGADGKIVARFEPKITPDDPAVTSAIEKALSAAKM